MPENTKDLSPELIEVLLPQIKKNCTTKFDESVDLSFQINNKQKKSEINIRTVINLPGGTGKKIKIAVVCEDSKVQEAKDSGAEVVGGDELIEKFKDGDLNFDEIVNVQDVIIMIDFIFNNLFFNEIQFESGDLNLDDECNIFDIIMIIDIILD